MDWEVQFQPQIVDRGYDYYRRGLVVNGQKSADEIHAIVAGTQDYHVVIKLVDDEVVDAVCDCPYAVDGKYCKHMAATLFWAFGEDDDQSESENVDTESLTVTQLVDRASDQQVRDFLASVLQIDDQLAKVFRMLTSSKKTVDSLEDFQEEVQEICDSYEDSGGFIDYQAAGDFEEEMATFIRDNIQLAVEQQQWSLAFHQLTATVMILSRVDIDDSDGELMMLAGICHDLWRRVIQQADLPLQREIFAWLQKHANASLLAFEELVTDLLAENFTTLEFIRLKLNWTMQRLQQAQRQEEEWEARKWATWHLKLMIQAQVDQTEIARFCTANAHYGDVRQVYITYCLERRDYSTALAQLTEGKQQAQTNRHAGVVRTYSRQLKDLYHQLDRPADYQRELWQLVTTYDPANLADFQELKQLYSATEWPVQRRKLFAALPPTADVAQLYAEEGLLRQLLQAVLAQPGLSGVQTYEKMLMPKFSDRLLQKYVAVAEQMASQTGDRKHYRKIVKVLNQMTAYPMGSNTASQLIKTWRVKYARRSAMLDELSKFKGVAF
ncbi:MAG TPA: SWIM zinc finger family protein [Levilactobacillus hammesii]|uniref:SWIM zinc finger family protein n=1 Tax=Levilactobacillus hammesii TaxID=267633 RepID=A0A921JWY1_9LACO|nr:SWIM zinc finger family protein [Levilactobacillus hammesii]